jgi:hypothetical protein
MVSYLKRHGLGQIEAIDWLRNVRRCCIFTPDYILQQMAGADNPTCSTETLQFHS